MNGGGIVAAFVSIGSLVVVGSILYQAGRAKNTVPALNTLERGATTIVGTLYK